MAIGKINTTSVNLRVAPASDSEILTVLVKDTDVDTRLPSEDGTWTLVFATVNSIMRIGWVQSQFITVGGVTPPPGGGTLIQDGTLLRGDGSFSFTAVVSGNDIVVNDVTSTWFGGNDDPNDNGQTASGLSTRDNPDLVGCALPMDRAGSPRTDGSPIPKLPYLSTMVSVTNRKNNMTLSVKLIDLGPAKPPASRHALDLTKAAFKALGGNPDDGVMRVDYTIVGGARHLPGSGGGSVGRFDHGGSVHGDRDPHHGQAHDVEKPLIKQFIASPNFNSRNGTKIDMIVMHYTAGSTAQGAINRFLDPREQVSAHYIIERNGDIFQMVNDSEKAWHAKSANPRSIGIEHVAVGDARMTLPQQDSSVALVRWLVATYDIPLANIRGHRFAPGNEGTTDCPNHLFGEKTEQAIRNWVAEHIEVTA